VSSVEIRSVRKTFGTLEVIHGVDVDIEDGEFVILVGPSGCGKSTLLRMIAGLEEIDAGDIMIGETRSAVFPYWDPKDTGPFVAATTLFAKSQFHRLGRRIERHFSFQPPD
jgi:multiple sugar transport system ATP-binding protein